MQILGPESQLSYHILHRTKELINSYQRNKKEGVKHGLNFFLQFKIIIQWFFTLPSIGRLLPLHIISLSTNLGAACVELAHSANKRIAIRSPLVELPSVIILSSTVQRFWKIPSEYCSSSSSSEYPRTQNKQTISSPTRNIVIFKNTLSGEQIKSIQFRRLEKILYENLSRTTGSM